MSYLGYILGAYGAAIAVLGGLLGWVLSDQRARRRELAELETSGVRRRSERQPEPEGKT